MEGFYILFGMKIGLSDIAAEAMETTGSEPDPAKQGPVTTPMNPQIRAILGHIFVNMPLSHLPRYIDLILGNGINVELGLAAEELDGTDVAEIAETVGKLRERGCRITVHGPFWDLCPGSIDPAIRQVSRSRLVRLFEVLEHVRPTQIVCHTGFDPRHHRSHRSKWIENSLGVWEFFVDWSEQLGAPLLIENVWEEDPELHVRLLEAMDSPWFGFCLDTGHQNAFSRTSLSSWLTACSPYLREVHLHDNDGSFDHHLPIGRGNIDFDYLFRFLDGSRMRPLMTIEPHKEEHLFETLTALSGMESFLRILRSA